MHSDVLLLLSLFSRMLGFFVFSPLFMGKSIPVLIRLGLTCACSLLLAPPLIAKVGNLHLETFSPLMSLVYDASIGYLLGFVFSLLFEAATFAGGMIGTLMGFSATEILDPILNSRHPLLGRLFGLSTFALFLAQDFHHFLLRLLFDSVQTLPLLTEESLLDIVQSIGWLFSHALDYAIFPMVILLSLILIFAIISRFFPIFWIGFPLQLLAGFAALILSIGFFAPILENGFLQLWKLIAKNLFSL